MVLVLSYRRITVKNALDDRLNDQKWVKMEDTPPFSTGKGLVEDEDEECHSVTIVCRNMLYLYL